MKKMIGDIPVIPSNHEFSYLLVNLYTTLDFTIRLAPFVVLAFLENVRYDQSNKSNKGGYGPWIPIAEKVSQPHTPILRAMGCFMLEDKKGFAEAANGLAERDPDAEPLASSASLRLRYPDPIKEH